MRPAGERRAAGETVDLDGRYVIPGLWDNHVHMNQWALTTRRLDVSAAASAAEAARHVAVRADATAAGETLVGFGFRDGLWADPPSVQALDAAAGSVPVVLVSADLHCCWLNSAALAQYGFTAGADGLLREEDAFSIERVINTVDDATLDRWVQTAAQAAAARGVVGVVDLEMAWNLGAWERRIHSGTDSLRVEFGVYTQDLRRAIGLGLRTGQRIAGTRGLLSVGPYKVITDGSLNTRTAYCFDEYPGLEGTVDARGQLTVPPEELLANVRLAVAAGLLPAVHAIGDQANALALDAFEELGCAGSIEHAQLLRPADIERFARLGIVASVQPEHALDDRDVADHFWAGRTSHAFMLRALLDAGARLALGSDAPVAPLDPWVTIAAAVGRTRDGREAWHPEQAITVPEALAASTRGRTVVAVGDAADLAIIETDPLDASVDELRRMTVAATLLAGRFTHNAV
ncbi:amidohydrolase [Cryobacterium tepidiphilum]|uniref:Amidohydrolase n=2 Tax=Cryobacterium tepidiphilum TaxID=2486026 RepID=A0A3M8KX42_9MICO|nr:amidohydrolase [Cryobacterium tepidiphilum]